MYGEHPLNPASVQLPENIEHVPAAEEFAQKMLDISKDVQQHIVIAQERQKKQADKHRRHEEFQVGDRVLLSTQNIRFKLAVPKLTAKRVGPFPIVKKISSVAYKLQLPAHWKIHDVFHVSLLTRYQQSGRFHTEATQYPEPDIVDGEEEYEVEAILGKRTLKRGRGFRNEYLVKWKGFPAEHNTWESAANLTHCEEALEEWQQRETGVHEDAHFSEEGEDVTITNVRGARTRGRGA